MNNLMTLWSEGFLKFYPSVRVEIEGKGSSTAPPALIAGTATFGPMSRAMKPNEMDAFEKRYGYKPVQLGTSIDMLAVYVNKDNPIEGLTLPQADAIFSSTRKLGYKEDITHVGTIGTDRRLGQFANQHLRSQLGVRHLRILQRERAGRRRLQSVRQGAARQLVGRPGRGHGQVRHRLQRHRLQDGGRACRASGQGARRKMVPAEAEHAYSGDYPLARFLWLSVNYKPGSQLDPLRREFIKYMFSKQGQEAVLKDGYYPVSAPLAKKSLASVGIKIDDGR